MQTITLQVDDSFLHTLQHFLRQYPKEKISIKEDLITNELKKRIRDIDEGKMEMIPFQEGMDRVRAKLMSRYENHSNT